MAGTDALPTAERVKVGKSLEDHVCRVLVECYSFPLEQATLQDDMVSKTDRWYRYQSGKRGRVAIKARESRNDILVAVRDPWEGPANPNCRLGRDMLCEYSHYVTLSKDQLHVRVASGKIIKKIISEMWQELLEAEFKFQNRGFDSKKYPGCQLRLHVDAYHGHSKVLGFITTKTLEPNFIRYYNMVSLKELDRMKTGE